jgi:hypothetical protein
MEFFVMGVKTYSEYYDGQITEKQPVSILKEETFREIEAKKTYILMFPEIEKNEKRSFNFELEVNGKMKLIKVERNVVKTDNEDIKNILVQKGYSHLKTLDKEDKIC